MKNYRLKKEAVPFFKSVLATKICPWDFWNNHHVDEKALEVVEDAFIKYGHSCDDKRTDLGGWDEKGTHFYFTIQFPSVKYCENDKFSNGKVVRDLMNRIQSQINSFYSDYLNQE